MGRTDSVFIRAVSIHDPDLITAIPPAVRLVDESAIVPAEIRLAVIPFKRQLCNVLHVRLYKQTFTGGRRHIFFDTSPY